MKRANGNGSVTKLKGRRRRPYAAKITKWDTTASGQPIQRRIYIGYFSNRMEAENALYKYSKGELEPPKIEAPAFGEVWTRFMDLTERTKAKNTVLSRRSFHQAFDCLDPVRVDKISYPDLQRLIDEISPKYRKGTMSGIRSTLVLVFDYAERMEYITSNPAKKIRIDCADDTRLRARQIFTQEEITKICDDKSLIAKQILIMLYTGMRFTEAIELKLENIDLNAKKIEIVKSKSKAGVRTIPIHSKIYEAVQELYDNSKCGNLFYSKRGKIYSGTAFRVAFQSLMEKYDMNHIPHETRHTYATMLYNAGLDDYSIQLLVGHTDAEFTKNVYTHQTVSDLAKKLEQVK